MQRSPSATLVLPTSTGRPPYFAQGRIALTLVGVLVWIARCQRASRYTRRFAKNVASGTGIYSRMAQCFCGCGETVGGLLNKRKSANSLGRASAEAVDRLETLRPWILERAAQLDSDPADMIEFLEKHLQPCQAAARTCAEVVHGEKEFAAVDWSTLRGAIRDANGMASYFAKHGVG